MSEFLSGLIDVIFNFIFTLTDILLSPLNLLINSFLPNSFQNISQWVSFFFNELSSYGKLAISYFGLYKELVDIIIVLVVAIFSIPVAVHGVKTAVKWFRSFKL